MVDICKTCGKIITGRNKGAEYCNKTCHKVRVSELCRLKNGEKNPFPPSVCGTVSELTVSTDLLKKGFHVFRSISPYGPCDIVVLKGKKLFLIEVTTGSRNNAGKLMYPAHKKYAHIFDIIAVVENAGKITYIPELLC